MIIDKVEAFVLSHQLEESFYFSQHRYDTRTICLIRITLDNGLVGWGEGYGPAGLVKAGIEFFTPLILGCSPLAQEELWQSIYLRSLDHARSGVLLSALSAIDIALWDLRGKILNQPVSVLLGGRKRDSVKAYATGLYFTDCDDLTARLAKEARTHKEQGFTAVKMKVGLGVEPDVKNVRAVRAALGPDVGLMIDANHAYSFREALSLAEAVEGSDIAWFEEPLSPEDYEGYTELRGRARIPIAAGECEYLRHGFLRLFKDRCVDIAQPDPCATGGITETKKIADLAQTFGVDFAPHCWGSCVAVATSLHLLSNWDPSPGRLFNREPFLELDRTQNLFREELGYPKFTLRQGKVQVPEGPGLGVEIKYDLVSKYTIDTFSS
jgi:D-galactarolactone cycloisomerase